MTTSDSGAFLTGLPDVASLERMANEFFGVLKSSESPLSSAAAPEPVGTTGGDVSAASLDPVQALAGIPSFDAIPSIPMQPFPSFESPIESSFYFLDQAFGLGAPAGAPALPASPGALPAPQGLVTTQGVVPDVKTGREIFDVASIRRDFPILNERVNGRRLVWLDNGATTQKPQVVIDRISTFYERENSNIHRAAHTLAGRSTDAYESARESVRRFLNASSTSEIVFTRGATEAVNLVAWSWGKQNLRPGDEIVLSWLEHHANIVPWQRLAAETGARVLVAPVDDRGDLHVEDVQRLLGPRTRLVSFTQVSNALGTVTPVEDIVAAAHRYGAKVLIDGAQAVSHLPVDVQELDCDFYVFSGHKVFAPTGIGALFGKADVLEGMPPWQGGGNMISDVTFERSTYQPPPGRFEAGTGSIADAVGLGAALDYVQRIGRENIAGHEHALMDYLLEGLRRIPGLRTIGAPTERAGVVSFVIDGYRPEDIGTALDKYGVAVRAGHHCAQPILRRFGLESTVRPSLAVYNSFDDIDVLTDALKAITRGRTLAPTT